MGCSPTEGCRKRSLVIYRVVPPQQPKGFPMGVTLTSMPIIGFLASFHTVPTHRPSNTRSTRSITTCSTVTKTKKQATRAPVIDAADVWAELISSVPAHPGIVRRRVAPASERNIFLAVAHPALERMLIIVVSPSALPQARDLPSTRGVHTTIVHLDDSRSEVRVALTAPDILRVFATFVEDVAEFASMERDDAGALRAFALDSRTGASSSPVSPAVD